MLRNFTKPFFRIFKAKVGAHCDVKTLPEYVEGGELVFLKKKKEWPKIIII